MTNTQYLFLVSIGPIQEFIASARRSRDLWFGSRMLSELSRTAAATIVEQNKTLASTSQQHSNNQLIFPAPTNLDRLYNTDFNVANKIVAIIQQEPQDLAKTVEYAVEDCLQKLQASAFEQIKGDFDCDNAQKQIADLIEFLWVAVPYRGEAFYKATRTRLEALMAARKNTRTFAPVTWESDNPKSSLDGQRESVIYEKAYDTLTPDQLYEQYKVGQGERLSGVDVLKRLGRIGNDDQFPSTSHIAAGPLLHCLEQAKEVVTNLTMLWLEYYTALPNKTKEERIGGYRRHPILKYCDGSLLFEDRLGDTLKEEELEKAQRALREFFGNVARELQTTATELKPQPYYALLLADGDNMGKAIDSMGTPDEHRALSQALSTFADDDVPNIVRAHAGALVYAGGDDVLAFVPLHTVLECARALAVCFRKRMHKFTFCDEQIKELKYPTLSVGIAVTHHVEPLSDALELVRKAEKAAKKVPGKHALAVAVSKRSGSETIVKGTWGTIYRRLDYFVQLHQEDAIPDGAAYELRDLANRIGGHVLNEALEAEASRILKRKKTNQGAIDETILKKLLEMINGTKEDLMQFADELIIARMFADARKLAGLKANELIEPTEKERCQ